MSVTPPNRRTRGSVRPRLLHSWLPVVMALVLAVVAGWSIMGLNASSYRARQDRVSVPDIQSGVAESETLLLTTAKKRLAARGSDALAATIGAPPRMAVYYASSFASLRHLGAATGASRDADAVSRALLAMTVTQDGIYAGGAGALLAARRAPLAIGTLRAAFAAPSRSGSQTGRTTAPSSRAAERC